MLDLLASIGAGEGYRVSAIHYSPDDGFNTPKAMRLSDGGLLIFETNADERAFSGEEEVKHLIHYYNYRQ